MRAPLLIAGGLAFAAGNLFHPLEHSDSVELSPAWAASHLNFAAGAPLVAAGVPALAHGLRASKVGVVGAALLWLGMVLIPALGVALLALFVILIAIPALPGPEGAWIIAGTVLLGLAIAGAGWSLCSSHLDSEQQVSGKRLARRMLEATDRRERKTV